MGHCVFGIRGLECRAYIDESVVAGGEGDDGVGIGEEVVDGRVDVMKVDEEKSAFPWAIGVAAKHSAARMRNLCIVTSV